MLPFYCQFVKNISRLIMSLWTVLYTSLSYIESSWCDYVIQADSIMHSSIGLGFKRIDLCYYYY